jgi:hypothetical protein
LFAEGRTLALEKFKHAFESWWQTPEIPVEELRSSSIVMREEGLKVG